MSGRKRHLLVDTLGLVLVMVVHPAHVQDRDGAKQVLERIRGRFARLQRIWADGSYAGQLIEWVRQQLGCVLEIVSKPAEQHTFVVLPKRWIVERTFSWLGRARRLSKDYEAVPASSETVVRLAMIQLMLRRLEPP